MKRKSTIEDLQKDVEIPLVVQNKVNKILGDIKDKKEQNNKIVDYKNEMTKPVRKRNKRRFGIVAAVAVIAVATVSVGATVYYNWSKGLEAMMNVEEEQKDKLVENKTTTFMEQKAVDQGITVTAVQSITDNYYTHIAFKVEGFEVEDGVQPTFETVNVSTDGNDDVAAVGRFYDGLISGPDGSIMNADGTPLGENDGQISGIYKQADGSLECHVTLYGGTEKGYFINRKVHIAMNNLGTIEKAEYTNEVSGQWSFDLDLQGSDEMSEWTLDMPLGDTGATVVGAEISPISLSVKYQFPRTTETQMSDADAMAIAAGLEPEGNGEEVAIEVPIDPPFLRGVKMKDGTLYPYLYLGPGRSGYVAEDSDVFELGFAIDRIIDADQVEALLFEKTYAGDGVTPTEDHFYVVPLK